MARTLCEAWAGGRGRKRVMRKERSTWNKYIDLGLGCRSDDPKCDREESGPGRKEAKDNPKMVVPEGLVGSVPGIEKVGAPIRAGLL